MTPIGRIGHRHLERWDERRLKEKSGPGHGGNEATEKSRLVDDGVVGDASVGGLGGRLECLEGLEGEEAVGGRGGTRMIRLKCWKRRKRRGRRGEDDGWGKDELLHE